MNTAMCRSVGFDTAAVSNFADGFPEDWKDLTKEGAAGVPAPHPAAAAPAVEPPAAGSASAAVGTPAVGAEAAAAEVLL